MALLSLLFRRPVPESVAVVAELRLDGGLAPPSDRGRDADLTLLRLAKVNRVTRLLTTPGLAASLTARQSEGQLRRIEGYQGIEVVPVGDMKDVIRALWPSPQP